MEPPAKIWQFTSIFRNFLGVLLGFSAIVLFIMIVISGYKFIMSGGDPKSLASARSTLTYAVLGMILVASAYLILVIINRATGANILEFRLYHP